MSAEHKVPRLNQRQWEHLRSAWVLRSVTHPTMCALERRGLVHWTPPDSGSFGRWIVTAAGNAALAMKDPQP